MATSLFFSTPLIHPSQYRKVREATLGKLIGSSSFNQKGLIKAARTRLLLSLHWKAPVKSKRETVVPEPDYRIPIVLLGATGGLIYTDNLIAAVPVGLLGLLLLVQATRVRFVFDDEALEVKVDSELKESGENVFVGGKNRWNGPSMQFSTQFSSWVIRKQPLCVANTRVLQFCKLGVLVAKFSDFGLLQRNTNQARRQIHFFPIIFNGKQLYDTMVERAGSSKTSSPK